eukprot:scaffold686_cov245-Skeletonema_marinoi.AAC.13
MKDRFEAKENDVDAGAAATNSVPTRAARLPPHYTSMSGRPSQWCSGSLSERCKLHPEMQKPCSWRKKPLPLTLVMEVD